MLKKEVTYSPDNKNLSSHGLGCSTCLKGFFNFNKMNIQEKVCTNCDIKKSISGFGTSKTTIDGFRSWCKKCDNKGTKEYNKTKKGLLSKIYSDQRKRSRRRGYPMPAYTLTEFREFALKSFDFHRLYDDWVISGYDKMLIPSFDRDNDYKGYSFENFNRWMTWKDNKQKGHLDRKNGVNNKISTAIIAIKLGVEQEFYSQHSAARELCLNVCHINNVLKGRQNTHFGYTFKYKDKKHNEKTT